MEFRDKIEVALTPLVDELRKKLAQLPTLTVLDYYQFRIDAAQPDKSNVPDGFLFKWRYLWALLLSNPISEVGEAKDGFTSELRNIDELLQKIFEVYELGAIWEPGRRRRSEKEFLTRLGLGLKVREPDFLAFPEQIEKWALKRFELFDDSYFLPNFGSTFAEIMAWFSSLLSSSQTRLTAWANDLKSIHSDVESIQAEVQRGDLNRETAAKRFADLRIYERLNSNGDEGNKVHIFSLDELQPGISQQALRPLIEIFGIRPGQMGSTHTFPHDENPLEFKTLIELLNGTFFFLDPSNAYRIVARVFEREILANIKLRDRYLRNRDRGVERWVVENMKKFFPHAQLYPNYYLEKGSREKDLFIHDGDTAILVECKNSKIRTFAGTAADLLRFERDFENSVQYGYEQALEVKQRVLRAEETTFFDEKGGVYFSIKRRQISRFYIVCVTITPRGPLGTDLSYELAKPNDEPFPLALNLLDLDTICKHFGSGGDFVRYLQARERLHGRVCTGDELNYAGHFLKYGHLDFEDGTFVADDFSGIFDRLWYKEKGIEVKEPTNQPISTSIERRGNRITIGQGRGQRETVRVPPEIVEFATGRPVKRMKGSERNKPCPCGSGRKQKHCHGI